MTLVAILEKTLNQTRTCRGKNTEQNVSIVFILSVKNVKYIHTVIAQLNTKMNPSTFTAQVQHFVTAQQ